MREEPGVSDGVDENLWGFYELHLVARGNEAMNQKHTFLPLCCRQMTTCSLLGSFLYKLSRFIVYAFFSHSTITSDNLPTSMPGKCARSTFPFTQSIIVFVMAIIGWSWVGRVASDPNGDVISGLD